MAANQEHQDAQYRLGLALAEGRGVQRNPLEALRYFRMAADQGNSDAQFQVGRAFAFGREVQQNPSEAFRYFRMAADQGNSNAQFQVGRAFANGQGVQRDLSEALRYFLMAADQGNSSAQQILGNFYEHGWAVDQNFEEAARYYQLAADQGIEEAQLSLERLLMRRARSVDGHDFNQELLSLDQRIELRQQIIERVNEREPGWDESESIMRADIGANFFRSMNRIDQRYSAHAIQNREHNFAAISLWMDQMDPQVLGPSGAMRLAAARRGLEWYRSQSATNEDSVNFETFLELHTANMMRERLFNLPELLSLSWSARSDRAILSEEQIRRQRNQLILSLAYQMRAHNVVGHTSEIDFETPGDSAGCTTGAVIRLFESLDGIHPDVSLQSFIPVPTPLVISETMVEFAKTEEAREIISGSEREVVDPLFHETQGYQNYLRQLRVFLVDHLQGISNEELDRLQSDQETILQLIQQFSV